jgi:hypothetical protein
VSTDKRPTTFWRSFLPVSWESKQSKNTDFSPTSYTLKMETESSCETNVNYQSTWNHIADNAFTPTSLWSHTSYSLFKPRLYSVRKGWFFWIKITPLCCCIWNISYFLPSRTTLRSAACFGPVYRPHFISCFIDLHWTLVSLKYYRKVFTFFYLFIGYIFIFYWIKGENIVYVNFRDRKWR